MYIYIQYPHPKHKQTYPTLLHITSHHIISYNAKEHSRTHSRGRNRVDKFVFILANSFFLRIIVIIIIIFSYFIYYCYCHSCRWHSLQLFPLLYAVASTPYFPSTVSVMVIFDFPIKLDEIIFYESMSIK